MAKFIVMNSTIGRSPLTCRADRKSRKAVFGDWRIDDPPGAEFFQKPWLTLYAP